MKPMDAAYAAIHDCGKVVAASAYWSDDPKSKTRAMVDARKWERRGDEVVETDIDAVHAIGWCDCFRSEPSAGEPA